MNSDLHQRNVLLGLYAHELMGVTSSALTAGMEACRNGGSESLLECLLAQGALTRAQADAVAAYLQKQLDTHGSLDILLRQIDLSAGLARTLSQGELSADDSTILLSKSHDDTGGDFCTAGYVGDTRSGGGRFEKSRFHAAGGLGQVFEAKDLELNRVVALKEIKEEFADNEQSKLRFAKEAEITARLEHPGIVPVYGMGVCEDGRLFYAMRFIRGKSLKDAVLVFHNTDWRSKSEGEYNVALRGLLQRFIDACQAVYFAHRRGVIHRDLKPSNIMLGEYGETLVVDWGLAKPLGLRDESTLSQMPVEHTLRTDASSSATDTQLGHAVGSPSYMSPEQARGAHDMVDFRSDIYGLGATLFAILTGRPPVAGNEDFIPRIISGDIDRPRAVNRRVPRPLEAICLKALACHPGRRYQTVKALIADVERYLADEPVAAHQEGLSERTSRWSKKNRGLLLGSLVGSLGIATACLALLAVAATQRQLAQRESRALSEELSALVEAQQVLVLSANTAAVRPKSKPDSATSKHIQRLKQQVVRIENSIRDPQNKAAALERIAILLRKSGDLETAEMVAERALDLVMQLPQPPADKLNHLRGTYASVLYHRGKFDQAVEVLQQSLTSGSATTTTQRSERLNALAANYFALNNYQRAEELLREVVQVWEAELGPLTKDTLIAKNNLAMAIAGTDESLQLLEDVVKAVSLETWDDPALRMTATGNLAYVNALRGETETALKLFNKTWKQRRRYLFELRPDTMTDLLNLASVERRLGLFACAEADYEKVVSLRSELLGAEHPHTLFAQTGLGKTRLHLDRPGDALTPLQTAYQGLLSPQRMNHPWVNEARELYCYACLATKDWPTAQQVIDEWQRATAVASHKFSAGELAKAQLAAAEAAIGNGDEAATKAAMAAFESVRLEEGELAAYLPGVAFIQARLAVDPTEQRRQLERVAEQLAAERPATPPQLRHWLPQAYELLEQLARQAGDTSAAADWAARRAALKERDNMSPEDCVRARDA